MKKIVDLEKYREKKREEDPFEDFESEFREVPEEEFEEILDYEIDLNFDNYTVYDEEFIKQNAEHIAHHTIPYCTVCNMPLEKGDRVDSMFPLGYGHNVCKGCESKMPKKMKKKKIVNLDKIELIFVEEDFKKIMNHLTKKEIINIKGNKIISEELYHKIKYQIIGMEDDLRL